MFEKPNTVLGDFFFNNLPDVVKEIHNAVSVYMSY